MRLRKLAVVLQHASTGGMRYTWRLIEGLSEARKDLEITLFLGRKVHRVDRSAAPWGGLEQSGVKLRTVPSLKPWNKRNFIAAVFARTKRWLGGMAHRRWIRECEQHDLVFFAWPYGIEVPRIQKPMAFIPHDLNYAHFVGNYVDKPRTLADTRGQHEAWFRKAAPVVSSQFIADEIRRIFPEYQRHPHVIPLSHLGSAGPLDVEQARQIVHKLGVHGSYALCLNNLSAHKNLGQVLSGFYYAQQQHPDLRLVLSGFGTEGIQGNMTTPFYLDNGIGGTDVVSLGLRTDIEIKALIQGARLVINGSLYEAGNGSGLDAWSLGTPVAMSAIPAFLEHLHVLGVRAQTFNPRCCYEIGDAILRILDDPQQAELDSRISRAAMLRYPWSSVGERYAQFFEQAAFGALKAPLRHPLAA
ncbi:MAG: hypothetical protein ABL921_22500 [Pirellula sp.]